MYFISLLQFILSENPENIILYDQCDMSDVTSDKFDNFMDDIDY